MPHCYFPPTGRKFRGNTRGSQYQVITIPPELILACICNFDRFAHLGPAVLSRSHHSVLDGYPPPGRISSGAIGSSRRWVSPLWNLRHRNYLPLWAPSQLQVEVEAHRHAQGLSHGGCYRDRRSRLSSPWEAATVNRSSGIRRRRLTLRSHIVDIRGNVGGTTSQCFTLSRADAPW